MLPLQQRPFCHLNGNKLFIIPRHLRSALFTYPPLVDPKNQPPWQQPDGVLYPAHVEEDGVAVGKRPEDPQKLLPRIVLTKMNLHESKEGQKKSARVHDVL
jgi:hypothetical protein